MFKKDSLSHTRQSTSWCHTRWPHNIAIYKAFQLVPTCCMNLSKLATLKTFYCFKNTSQYKAPSCLCGDNYPQDTTLITKSASDRQSPHCSNINQTITLSSSLCHSFYYISLLPLTHAISKKLVTGQHHYNTAAGFLTLTETVTMLTQKISVIKITVV